MVITSAFQADDESSILFFRSIDNWWKPIV